MNKIRLESKKMGYKTKMDRIYVVLDDVFIHSSIDFLNHEYLDYDVCIKNCKYDDIFWEIMQMSENCKESIALRAVGAYKSPSVKIKSVQLEIIDNYDEIACYLINDIDESARAFIKKHSIDEYVINWNEGMYNEVLKCLAYIHRGDIHEARLLAKECVEKGDSGGFKNAGKSFFEWLILSVDDSVLP